MEFVEITNEEKLNVGTRFNFIANKNVFDTDDTRGGLHDHTLMDYVKYSINLADFCIDVTEIIYGKIYFCDKIIGFKGSLEEISNKIEEMKEQILDSNVELPRVQVCYSKVKESADKAWETHLEYEKAIAKARDERSKNAALSVLGL